MAFEDSCTIGNWVVLWLLEVMNSWSLVWLAQNPLLIPIGLQFWNCENWIVDYEKKLISYLWSYYNYFLGVKRQYIMRYLNFKKYNIIFAENSYMLGGSHDCKTLWFPCISVRLAMIFECRMTTWLGFKWGFSKWPVDFHTWHFCSTWDKFIRTLAMEPMSKTSNIRAEYGVFRYLNFFPMSFFISLLL